MFRVRVVLPGPPRGKQVAQVTRRGTFIPKKTMAEMEALRWIAVQAMKRERPFQGPVEIKICAYMPVPPSWPRARRELALANKTHPTSKPDGSNIQKLVEDALIRIVFLDDSQIVRWTGWKVYSADPRVVIEVSEITTADE